MDFAANCASCAASPASKRCTRCSTPTACKSRRPMVVPGAKLRLSSRKNAVSNSARFRIACTRRSPLNALHNGTSRSSDCIQCAVPDEALTVGCRCMTSALHLAQLGVIGIAALLFLSFDLTTTIFALMIAMVAAHSVCADRGVARARRVHCGDPRAARILRCLACAPRHATPCCLMHQRGGPEPVTSASASCASRKCSLTAGIISVA